MGGCDFENGFCGYSVATDNSIWGFKRMNGKTPSSGTGPEYSFEGGKLIYKLKQKITAPYRIIYYTSLLFHFQQLITYILRLQEPKYQAFRP